MKKKRDVGSRGISPVIATVLLVSMVVIIGLIIFLWFEGFTGEVITKFGEKNIELVCDDVVFDASYYGGTLYITNNGDVPIFGFQLRLFEEGSHSTIYLDTSSQLNQGGTFSQYIEAVTGSVNKLVLIPVLLGNSKSGQRTFVCNEAQYGYEILV